MTKDEIIAGLGEPAGGSWPSWRETERMLKATRDREMKVTLPKVSIQQELEQADVG